MTDPRHASAPGGNGGGAKNLVGTGSAPILSAAADAVAGDTGRCRACGHVLTADTSVHRQLGPVCAHRLAAAVRVPGWYVEDVVVGDHGNAIVVVLMPEAVTA